MRSCTTVNGEPWSPPAIILKGLLVFGKSCCAMLLLYFALLFLALKPCWSRLGQPDATAFPIRMMHNVMNAQLRGP